MTLQHTVLYSILAQDDIVGLQLFVQYDTGRKNIALPHAFFLQAHDSVMRLQENNHDDWHSCGKNRA